MNAIDTTKENVILDEFLLDKPKRGRSFDALTISSLLYIAFVLMDFVFDIERLSLKQFEWDLAMAILTLPLIGVILHLAGKRLGWIINYFYYLFITLIIIYGFITTFLERDDERQGAISWRIFLFFGLALISTIFLSSTSIRKYFSVSGLLLIVISILSLGLTITMVFAVIEQ